MPYKNREDALAYGKKWRLENPSKAKEMILDWEKRNPDKVKAKFAKHRAKYKEKRAVQSRAWREANPERLLQYNEDKKEEKYKKNSVWWKNNHDKAKCYANNRRARKTEAGGSFTPQEWFTLCFAVGFKCLCCGESKPLVADHIVPVSKGGTSWLWNIQPLCASCNSKKSDKTIDFRINLDLNTINYRTGLEGNNLDKELTWQEIVRLSMGM